MRGIICNFIFILYMFGLLSCNSISKLQKQMEGYWGIDSFIIDDVDYALTNFSSNAIVFSINNKCRLPQFYYNNEFVGEQNSNWRIIDSVGLNYIIFEGADNLISDAYLIKFIYSDRGDLYKIILENEDIKIKMTKALANFN